MSLKDRMNDDLKTAMKAREKDRVSVLRMLLSEMKYAAAQVNVHQDLSDDEAGKVVSTYHKRLTKSLEEFPEGEQRQQIRSEIAIVESYLPKKADEKATLAAIIQVLSKTEDKNFGSLMKLVMAQLGGEGDGKLVSKLLKERLGG
jgi:uncharacterized protein YqeY